MTVFPKKLNSLVTFIVERPVTQTDEVDINTQSKKFVKFKFLDEKGKNKRIDPIVIIRKNPNVKTAGGLVSSLSFNCLINCLKITSKKNPFNYEGTFSLSY